MKFTPHVAALGALLCFGASGTAHAQTGPGNAYYMVANETLAGGGTAGFVQSDVTFEKLFLTEKFSDGFTDRVSLFDSNGTQYAGPGTAHPAPGVDTGTIFVFSNNFFNSSPTHGALTLATLTGLFDNGLGQGTDVRPDGTFYQLGDTETFDVYTDTQINGPTNSVNVFADFTASLVNPVTGQISNKVPIYAIDSGNNGAKYEAGVFSLEVAPEPSPLALLGLGVVGVATLGVVARRRSANTTL